MKIKSAPIRVKAGEDDGLEEGQFVAYASTFTREPDSYGDVVAPGAFADTLKAWGESGNVLPVLFGHRFDDPDYNIGGVVEAVEDERGLKVTGQLDLENPKSAQVYRLLKGRRIGEMSFAYDVLEEAKVVLEDGTKVNELRKLDLFEVSVVPVGANRDTEIVAVKAATDALAKAGRVLAEKHITSLREAQEAIGRVIAAAEVDEDQEEKASEAVDVKPGASDEEQGSAKSSVPGEEQKRDSSVDPVLAAITIREKGA